VNAPSPIGSQLDPVSLFVSCGATKPPPGARVLHGGLPPAHLLAAALDALGMPQPAVSYIF